ncbi:MAG TPA: hypothetical protein VF534_01405 [Paraburkholderia sp.]
MSSKPFGEVFRERVDRIEEEAKKVGLNFTSICEIGGISRATPDRWRREMPKTIQLVEQMEQIIADRKAEIAAARAASKARDTD